MHGAGCEAAFRVRRDRTEPTLNPRTGKRALREAGARINRRQSSSLLALATAVPYANLEHAALSLRVTTQPAKLRPRPSATSARKPNARGKVSHTAHLAQCSLLRQGLKGGVPDEGGGGRGWEERRRGGPQAGVEGTGERGRRRARARARPNRHRKASSGCHILMAVATRIGWRRGENGRERKRRGGRARWAKITGMRACGQGGLGWCGTIASAWVRRIVASSLLSVCARGARACAERICLGVGLSKIV